MENDVKIKEMTILELVSYLATNKNRFCYKGEYTNDLDEILNIIDKEIEKFSSCVSLEFVRGMKHIKNLIGKSGLW